MADDQSFLHRWAKRKQASHAALPKAEAIPTESVNQPPTVETVDLASLPSIESLTSSSEFAAFMKVDVPQSLRQQALRRLWVLDPDIRNHQPLVDYAWDFNAPDYGQLWSSDDIVKLAERITGQVQEKVDAPVETSQTNTSVEPTPLAVMETSNQQEVSEQPERQSLSEEKTSSKAEAEEEGICFHHRHGSALPR